MPELTLTRRLRLGLLAMGWQPDDTTNVSTAEVFRKEGAGYKLFLGTAGSVRMGRIKSKSFPVNDKVKAAILKAAAEMIGGGA